MDVGLIGVACFLSGIGVCAMWFSRVMASKLDQVHTDATLAAERLLEHQTTGIQKVEEQNMHAVLKRIDVLEGKE